MTGQVLAIATLGMLTAAVTSGGSVGWNAPYALATLAVAVLCGALFITTEARAHAPMLPIEFFRRPAFRVSAIVGFAINLTLYGQIFVLSLFWQRVQGYSPLLTGRAFLPFA